MDERPTLLELGDLTESVKKQPPPDPNDWDSIHQDLIAMQQGDWGNEPEYVCEEEGNRGTAIVFLNEKGELSFKYLPNTFELDTVYTCESIEELLDTMKAYGSNGCKWRLFPLGY